VFKVKPKEHHPLLTLGVSKEVRVQTWGMNQCDCENTKRGRTYIALYIKHFDSVMGLIRITFGDGNNEMRKIPADEPIGKGGQDKEEGNKETE
jgi:hypothetical protein